jgi:beta-mannanase
MAYVPKILNGTYDAALAARAAGFTLFGSPVVLAYAPGMDTGARVVAATPATFAAAWQHTKAIFDAAGVTNVRWAWCPTAGSWVSGTAMQWYPGAAYVDLVCAQGTPSTGPSVPSFGSQFAGFLQDAGATGKPLMV